MRGEEKKANIERRNFPDGKPRRKVKQMDPITAHTASPDETFVGAVVETLLKQYGRDFLQDPCVAEVCDDYTIGIEYPLTKPPWLAATCCAAKMTQLSSPNLVNDKRRETIEETAEAFNPSHIDLLYTSVPPLTEYAQAYSGTALVQLGLTAIVPQAPCGSCPMYLMCNAASKQCTAPSCAIVKRYCNNVDELGRRTRAICPLTCGCESGRRSDLALSLPREGCGHVDTNGITRKELEDEPCEDVPKDDPVFGKFLDNKERIALSQPLDLQTQTLIEVRSLRKYGCEYLTNTNLWDDVSTVQTFFRDAKVESLVRPPYFLGRNPCARYAGSSVKPLSVFCPRACGCHRGDQDCPTTCPERHASTPLCPGYQKRILPGDVVDCPRLPAAQPFDVGVVLGAEE